MAVTVSVVARSLGVMVISAAAPLVVSEPSQISRLYDWQLPIWYLLFAAALWVCADRPPRPPSASAAAQWRARDAQASAPLELGVSHNYRALQFMWADTRALGRNTNFMFLAVSFSLLTGIGWTFLTVVGQLLEPCGYSNLLAGIANAVFMGANAIGCFVAAPIVESTRAYLTLQRVFSWMTMVTCLAVLGAARPGDSTSVLVAWAALGFSMGPLTPVSFEHAVEMTYPLPANSSNTILNVVSNLVGFIQTVGITPLLTATASATCSSVVTPAAGFMLICTALGLLFTQFISKDYRRQGAEGVVAGDPWECGEERGYAAKIRPGALPGPVPAVDAETPLLKS